MTKKSILFLLILSSSYFSIGQHSDSMTLEKIASNIMLEGKCYDWLRTLTKDIGHRLSGSTEAEKAVAWGAKTLLEAGADTVWLQSVEVPHWERGKESLSLELEPGIYTEVDMLSLGNSEGTQGKLLEKEIVYVENLDALEQLNSDQIKGKIVFYNYKFRQDLINTFKGYSDAVKYRTMGVNKAAQKGAVGVIIRSVSTALDDAPHTGMTRYEDGVNKIPAIAIGNLSSDQLANACKKGKTKARIISNCSMKGTRPSFNVIGELTGKINPDHYIVVSGHLDSWDVGEGAHDDGAGCVQSMEVLRTFKNLGIEPKNTLRVVLYMNEENGVKGGQTYADEAYKNNEKHVLAMESDAGGFVPRGISLDMHDSLKTIIKGWSSLFLPYGIYDFTVNYGGVDIGPLKKHGVPLAGLLPDPQRYFDLHHSKNDVFEAINHRELKLGAVTMATFIYLIDTHF